MDLGELQRAFFDGVYTYRIGLGVTAAMLAVVGVVIALRYGWFAAARRHPGRTGVVAVAVLAVALPVGYYLASPLWIRTGLVEPDPVAIVDPTPAPTAEVSPAGPVGSASSASAQTPVSSPAASPIAPTSAAFVSRRLAIGSFHGTDDFHFGRGTASIIETAPGTYVLRLDAFSVRNGPDLYVYLSPAADDYAKGALEVGRLKATDGAFGYELPRGTEPAEFASAIIWCKQFSHLFAVAPLDAN